MQVCLQQRWPSGMSHGLGLLNVADVEMPNLPASSTRFLEKCLQTSIDGIFLERELEVLQA